MTVYPIPPACSSLLVPKIRRQSRWSESIWFLPNHSQLCANLTALLSEVQLLRRGRYYDDSANSYKYIVFILIIYAVSFLSLMVKYFWSGKARRYDELYDQVCTLKMQ